MVQIRIFARNKMPLQLNERIAISARMLNNRSGLRDLSPYQSYRLRTDVDLRAANQRIGQGMVANGKVVEMVLKPMKASV